MTGVTQFVLTRFHSKAAVLAIALFSAGQFRQRRNIAPALAGQRQRQARLQGRQRKLQEVFPAVPQPMKFCV